jgi:hypothetical protein
MELRGSREQIGSTGRPATREVGARTLGCIEADCLQRGAKAPEEAGGRCENNAMSLQTEGPDVKDEERDRSPK